MKLDFNKILDVFQPSYQQIRVMFIISLTIIGILIGVNRGIGGRVANVKDIDRIEIDMIEVKSTIDKNNIKHTENLYTLYRELLDMNNRHDNHWDLKFKLFLDYGHDRELFDRLIDIQNNQRLLYEENRISILKYTLFNNDPPPINDTIN